MASDGIRVLYEVSFSSGAVGVMKAIRRIVRRAVPEPIRLRIVAGRRAARDCVTGDARRMVGPEALGAPLDDANLVLAIAQPIRRTDHWRGKLNNLRLAGERLGCAACGPEQILSFWRLIGRPDARNGFSVGRSIRSGRVEADMGGGLCQISGLLYELGLRVGMDIAERHPHAKDLYDEDTRFTPLGLDATVVWGHKDLRLRNGLRHPLIFSFDLTDEAIEGRVHSHAAVRLAEIAIERNDDARTFARRVRVWRGGEPAGRVMISEDCYIPRSRLDETLGR
jgi:vancomycin resistance protein VanW